MEKRFFRETVFLLLASMLLLPCSVAAADMTEEDELDRAAQIGLELSLAGQETVSGQDYAALLDHFIRITDPAKSGEWARVSAQLHACTRPLNRAEGMVALACAAEIVGGGYVGLQRVDDLWALNGTIGEPWDDFQPGSDIFDGDYLSGASTLTEFSWTRDATGYFYGMSRYSAFSGQRVFTYDPQSNSMNPHLPLTGTDALLAVERLFDSVGYVQSDRVLTPEDEAILSAADQRRSAIFSSDSEYTVGTGGKVYYVSPDGDDGYDGLSPETAWKTLGKVNSAAVTWSGMLDSSSFPEYQWASEHDERQWASLNSGDVVLFQRGGQWRGMLRTVAGVTYSAYGEGPKPELLSSPENGAGTDKWKLVEGTTNLWEYYCAMQDCGGILLGKDTVAIKKTAYWDGSTYLDVGRSQWAPVGDYQELQLSSLDDLWFFNDINYGTDAFDFSAYGTLYLRCDEGNPGVVYDSIEFFTGNNTWNEGAVTVKDHVTLDNLCFRCFAAGADAHGSRYATVRNCVFEWGGGILMEFTRSDTTLGVVRTGDGIMLGGKNNVASNNYVAHIFDAGLNMEAFCANTDEDLKDHRREDCAFTGNLVESCGNGVIVADWTAWNAGMNYPVFRNITISDNYFMHMNPGGWIHGEDVEAGGTYLAPLCLYLNPGCENIRVTDNVLYDTWSVGQLVSIGLFEGEASPIILSGNTYVQKNLVSFSMTRLRSGMEDGWTDTVSFRLYDADAAQTAADLGDQSATVLPPSFALPAPFGAVTLRMDAAMTEAYRAGALLWLAEYEASGRMTAFQQVIPAKDGTVVLFPCEDTARGSLLCLDGAWKPRACHQTIKC